MTRFPSAAVLLALASALAACQPNPDPAQAGFFSGLGNIGSGAYEARAAQQRAQLDVAMQQQQALRQTGKAEQVQQQRLDAEATGLRRRRQALKGDLATMRRELEAARGERDADQDRLRQFSAQLATLEQASAQLEESHAESARLAEQIAEAEARRDRLRAVMNQALSLRPVPRPPAGS
jgi:chromosome segregation ATPase